MAGVVLQDMEEAAAALSHSIEASRKDKGQLLADIVDTEKQVTRLYALPVSHHESSIHGLRSRP